MTYNIVDIALVLNGVKIAIEYDSWFWHGHKQKEDLKRLTVLRKNGWKTLQIKANTKLPSKKQLQKALSELAYTKATKRTIRLNDWGIGKTRFKKG